MCVCVCVKESVGAEEKVCSRRMRQPSTRLVFCRVARLVVDSSSWSFYYCRTLVARAALHIASSNVLRNAHLGSQREDERERDRDDLCRVSSDRQASRCSTVDTNLPVRFYNNSSNDSRARDAVEGRCGRQPNAMCRCRAILETCGFPAGGPGCDDEIWSTSGSRCLGGTVGG